jgi:hypothetical protein
MSIINLTEIVNAIHNVYEMNIHGMQDLHHLDLYKLMSVCISRQEKLNRFPED